MSEVAQTLIVDLEKKGRTRGRLVTVFRPWSKRTFQLERQSLKYFDGKILKGEIILAQCKVNELSAAQAEDKPFPFQIETPGGEVILLSAASEIIRTITMQFIAIASTTPNFSVPFIFNGSQQTVDVKSLTHGKIVQTDGIYMGDLLHGKKHGFGTILVIDGSVIEGDFEDDVMHGKVKVICANGFTFHGDYVRGIMEGQGTLTYPNGDTYIGAVSNNKLNGFGTRYYKTGGIYAGNWVNGEFSGHGKFTLSTKDVLEGNFVSCSFREGVWRYPNGDIFLGHFSSPPDAPHKYMKHGYGRLIRADGRVSEGTCRPREETDAEFEELSKLCRDLHLLTKNGEKAYSLATGPSAEQTATAHQQAQSVHHVAHAVGNKNNMHEVAHTANHVFSLF